MPAKKTPITVCVINLKGGVGKSTISALLCRYAVTQFDLDVLAIDLDPQANLSQALMRNSYNDFLLKRDPSIVELFNGYIPPNGVNRSSSPLPNIAKPIYSYGDHGLDLIPSRFDFSDSLIDAVRPDPKTLAKYLSKEFSEKDLIIIDCAPTESILTRAAYHASGYVLVPVKPEYFATIGFPLLNQSLNSFRSKNRSHKIDVIGIVVNNGFYHGGNNGGPEKKRAMDEIRSEARKNHWPIYKKEIPFSRGFPKMMRGDFNYSGNASGFFYFAGEFLDSLGL